MRHRFTYLATILLALAAAWGRPAAAQDWPHWRFDSPNSALNFRENLLFPPPDLFWFSADFGTSGTSSPGGTFATPAASPIVLDLANDPQNPGASDPMVFIGRRDRFYAYRPDLLGSFASGAIQPAPGWPVTLKGLIAAPPVAATITQNTRSGVVTRKVLYVATAGNTATDFLRITAFSLDPTNPQTKAPIELWSRSITGILGGVTKLGGMAFADIGSDGTDGQGQQNDRSTFLKQWTWNTDEEGWQGTIDGNGAVSQRTTAQDSPLEPGGRGSWELASTAPNATRNVSTEVRFVPDQLGVSGAVISVDFKFDKRVIGIDNLRTGSGFRWELSTNDGRSYSELYREAISPSIDNQWQTRLAGQFNFGTPQDQKTNWRLRLTATLVTGTDPNTNADVVFDHPQLTFNMLGSTSAQQTLPLLFVTTQDGQVLGINAYAFDLPGDRGGIRTVAGSTRWTWRPGGGGAPRILAGPAVARVPLDGFNSGLNVNGRSVAQDIVARNREWLVFAGDEQGNVTALEAFGQTDGSGVVNGAGEVRWRHQLPAASTGERDAVLTPPLVWNGATGLADRDGRFLTRLTGFDDVVMVGTRSGQLYGLDAQGDFILTGNEANKPAGAQVGDPLGTTQRRWRFPDLGDAGSTSTDPAPWRTGGSPINSPLAVWNGIGQTADNPDNNSINLAHEDDLVYARFDQNLGQVPGEPTGPTRFREFIGAVRVYGRIETENPIDAGKPVHVFAADEAEMPGQFFEVTANFLDSSADNPDANNDGVPDNSIPRGRITLVKQRWVDDQGTVHSINLGDRIRVVYTPAGAANTTEEQLPFPSRRRQAGNERTGLENVAVGTPIRASIGYLAASLQDAGTQTNGLGGEELRIDAGQVDQFLNQSQAPAMAIANNTIWVGSRYRGRFYEVDAEFLRVTGFQHSTNDNPDQQANREDDLPSNSDPVGSPGIAFGWLYVAYDNGLLAAYSNEGGGAPGSGSGPVGAGVGPGIVSGRPRNNSIDKPQIRVTDANGNPLTDEDHLLFDWGETIFIKVNAIVGGGEGFFGALTRSPIRATLRGPMGDLPPVTVTPVRVAADNPEREALLEIVVPNATSSNPMTPGTKLLKDTPLSDRFKEAHWELRVEQIGVGWRGGTAPNGQTFPEGPWEPSSKDQEPGAWTPDSNTAPWISLNNPIALVYDPLRDPELVNPDRDANVAFVARFSSDPGFQRRAERLNGDPYKQPAAADYNKPTVLTVGTDPVTGRQLLLGDHGKSTPGMMIGIADRTDLGVTGGRGPLRVRVQGAKLTKLGSASLLNGGSAGSINQNAAYPDDGPDGYYPSITGDRMKVIKRGDGSNATVSSVDLLGALTTRSGPDARPDLGPDGKPVKRLQVDPFIVSVEIPRYQPDDIYASRARVPNPNTGLFTPDTAINPITTPYLDYVGPGTAPPNLSLLQRDDSPARVTVFVDANNNGRLDLQGNYREAFRTFAVQLVVRPDFRLEVRDRTVDLGRVWHGFETPSFEQLGSLPQALQAFYRSYWKPFTLVNTGNVNLPKIKPEVVTSFQGQTTGLVTLPADGVDPLRSITLVRDPTEPGADLARILVDPTNIFLRTSLDDLLKPNAGTAYDRGPGAWLQKARVGAASPSAAIYPGDPSLQAAGTGTPALPRETFLTLNIPTGTPLGSYVGQVRFFNDQLVQAIPSTSNPLGFTYGILDTQDNGLLDRSGNTSVGFRTEPFTDPTFDLRVRVTENLALGSVLDASNNGGSAAGSRPASRTSPAAGLDRLNNRIALFYASNLQGMQAGRPLQFDLFGTSLPFDKDHNLFPFDPLPMNAAPWNPAFLISPTFNGPATGTSKSTKPGFTQDDQGRGFVFWSEQASVVPGRTETRLMYRQVTPDTSDPQPFAPGGGLDTLTPRSGPAPVVVPTTGSAGSGTAGGAGLASAGGRRVRIAAQNDVTNVWYLFWHGGSAQKQNLFFSRSATPEESRSWSAESLLPTSPSLASVSDPSPSYEPGTGTLWVMYTGLSQRLGKTDAYVTKYDPKAFGDRRQFYGLLRFAPVTADVLRPNGTRTLYAANGIDWLVDPGNPIQVYVDGYPLLRPGDPGHANAGGELLFDVDASKWPMLTQQGVRVVVDRAAGIVRFSMDARRMRGLMGLPPPAGLQGAIPPDPEISADYTPGTMRLTRSEQGASSAVGFVTHSFEPSWYRGLFDSQHRPVQGQADRLWVVWRRAAGAVGGGPSLYYKAFRPAIHVRRGSLRDLTGLKVVSRPDLVQGASGGSAAIPIQDVDLEQGMIFFRDMDEGLTRLHGVPTPVQVTYRDPRTNSEVNEIHFINWHEETGETPVPMDVAVNEGTVTAFPVADQVRLVDPGSGNVAVYPHLQKIWLFWASTRGSGSDIYQATIAPRFGPETSPLGPVSASITSRSARPRGSGTLPARSLR